MTPQAGEGGARGGLADIQEDDDDGASADFRKILEYS